jgi:type III secretion protein V
LTSERTPVYPLGVGREQGVGSGPLGLLALLRAGDVHALLTRHADLVLAALVVAIVGMMIVPLPTPVLDLLISINIAASVLLLLLSLYVGDALKIATFPTLLLLTTLYRLGLEVSATRLILLRADAGLVIRAFGGFVVAGNLIVGAVVFVILTAVQFIVISKGSERVAEVAARFTLDAMPGKQMAIDAELRAGLIDAGEARRRRASLARESQLFGSMDGAMKFVKGDAIAGLVVLAVNIVGGLCIGVLQRGMELGAAARAYTILTIGEGLVAQIPALVISTAAGIIVTRVASEHDGGRSHLGRDIGVEVLAHPKAIAVTAGLLALLAVVPGLPALPFLALAAALGLIAWRLGTAPVAADARDAGAGADAAAGPALLAPLAIEVSAEPAVTRALAGFADGAVPRLRARLLEELGLPLPPVRLLRSTPGLAGGAYVVRLDEVPLGRGEVPRGAWDDAAARIEDHLLALLRRHGHQLVGVQEAQALLDGLARTHPALVREVVPKLVPPVLLADVLRRLAREGVPLRNLRDVLGALAARVPRERDPAALAEHVRVALRRSITWQHAGERGVLEAYVLDPGIEETLREAVRDGAGGSHLALEPELAADILHAVGRALGDGGAVLLTGPEVRRHVRHLIEGAHPDVAVLTYAELEPATEIRTVGTVALTTT